MSKAIYTLVDADDIRDYLSNNIDLIDDDGSMTDEELDQTIDRIVDASTDGRLFEMIRDAFSDSWLFDKILDVVDDCMYDFVAECILNEKE